MKLSVLILCIIFIFSGCKKNHPDAVVYVSGYYFDQCGGQPMKNKALSIFQHDANSNTGGIIGSGSTDSMGYFKIQYGANIGATLVEIRIAGSNSTLVSLPGYPIENIDNLNIYNYSTGNIVVKLNVSNPYTNLDTLEIGDFRTQTNTKFPGPFSSGILYTANNYNMLAPNYVNTYTSIIKNMGYHINAGTWVINPFELKTCTTTEVIINIQ